MNHFIGTTLTVKWTYSGTLTANTAPTLWIDGVASAQAVTWDVATAGIARATVATTGRTAGQRLEFRGGSLTYGGTAYPIESQVYVMGEVTPTATSNAAAVRTNLATELARIDVGVSTRSTLTAANVWDYLTSAATTAGSLGKRIADYLGGFTGIK